MKSDGVTDETFAVNCLFLQRNFSTENDITKLRSKCPQKLQVKCRFTSARKLPLIYPQKMLLAAGKDTSHCRNNYL